ncbi:MAG: phospho-N-acetylmuramoyl-pentapeptide-transferase [Oscillospiraceae bacterium]|jgi:phospho-N-acetylmuramoyl-pentapeptide-transferase|nr:phospho-N-acetylmuramoyl-pentapeptide-transferase [Oscillospiraceae bacterium]
MIWAVVIAFIACLAVGPVLLPVLRRLKFGQNVYEYAPESHQKKQGTPTMGGWMICLVSVAVAAALHLGGWAPRTDMMLAALLLALGNLCVGFADDMSKIRRKHNKGLSPKQKMLAQVLLGAAFAFYCYAHPQVGPRIVVPFFQTEWDLGWFYIPAAIFIIVGTTNSANLLDGLDGLLGSVALVDAATFGLLALFAAGTAQGNDQRELMNLAVLGCAVAGACMGFLRFNVYPARLFMGDTGSMFLGGVVVALALLLRLPLLLPLIAFCMLISSLSDIIQIGYYKLTHGKRVFKMAPIHHHFEKLGNPESKIVAMYTIVTVLLCLVSLLSVAR